MKLKKILNNLLFHVFGFQLVSRRRVGISLFSEIRRTVTCIDVVLDVGANVGSSSLAFLKRFLMRLFMRSSQYLLTLLC